MKKKYETKNEVIQYSEPIEVKKKQSQVCQVCRNN